MVPFVERNYNVVELGPRGTGKSHLFQQVSPYAHLISGGKATVAQMFVNNANGQRGLVCQYDVVCFDEVSGVSFDQKDGVNIMKGYMESGEFSRGKESIRADGSIVMVGNFDVDVEHQQRIGHLFGPLPPEMRDDTAFMDRIHAYLPGLGRAQDERRPVHRPLRPGQRLPLRVLEPAARARAGSQLCRAACIYGGALSGRDTNGREQDRRAACSSCSIPAPSDAGPDEDLEWAVRLALESRRRVKEQQKRIGAAEFRNTHFSYTLGEDGVEQFVVDARNSRARTRIGVDPLPPGQVWAISPGGQDENPGLYRIEVNEGPGSGVKVLNKPVPAAVPGERQVTPSRTSTPAPRSSSATATRASTSSRVQLRAFDAAKIRRQAGRAGPARAVPAPAREEPHGRPDRRRRASTWAARSNPSTTPSASSSWPSRRAPASC